MRQYLDLLAASSRRARQKATAPAPARSAVFGHQMRFDLAEGFPLVTTKKLHLKSIIHELLWFLRGETNVALAAGERRHDLGRMGGRERRSRPGLRRASGASGPRRTAAHRPDRAAWSTGRSARTRIRAGIIVTAWNVGELDQMALPPCHCLFQFYVADGKLSCQLYQRSADIFLGVPFNIASYALLTLMVAQVTGLRPGEFVHTLRRRPSLSEPPRAGATQQLKREPRPCRAW